MCLCAVCQTGAARVVGSDVSCSQPTPCAAAEVLGDMRWLWLRPEENNRFRKQPTIGAVLPRRERRKKRTTPDHAENSPVNYFERNDCMNLDLCVSGIVCNNIIIL